MKGFGSSCGACKYLRRRCTRDCVFSPYFSYDEASTHFAAVHKVFGASNVSRLLLHLPLHNRSDAAITITYQALARMHDPIYGCVAYIYVLQQQVASLQREIDDILGNNFMMKNSSCLGVENYCGNVHQSPMMNINNGIEYIVQEGTRSQCYKSQLANQFSSDEEIDREYERLLLMDTDHLLYGETDPISLEKFLSGIDQDVFLNHPWFKHNNNNIIGN
ncbi:LOB domain-containing protein 33-like [Arachis stenosperma]|uniref:LOB domain-containing protein 33-like n=1 Tax=Arachis stenosperma TaxID=217475 RepID=UPI0025AD812E|nr:LOB domain-containing protein 33-like [Arachis stenosperma]